MRLHCVESKYGEFSSVTDPVLCVLLFLSFFVCVITCWCTSILCRYTLEGNEMWSVRWTLVPDASFNCLLSCWLESEERFIWVCLLFLSPISNSIISKLSEWVSIAYLFPKVHSKVQLTVVPQNREVHTRCEVGNIKHHLTLIITISRGRSELATTTNASITEGISHASRLLELLAPVQVTER